MTADAAGWWGTKPMSGTEADKQAWAQAWGRRRMAALNKRAEERRALEARSAAPGRLSNTPHPKYQRPTLQVLTVAKPEQLDFNELAQKEGPGWSAGDVSGDVLAVGADWLSFTAYGGELRADIAEQLADLRDRVERGDPTVVRIAGRDYSVQGRGARPVFRWLLVGPEATIAVRAPKVGKVWGPGDMSCRVELRAVTLWRFGARTAAAMWREAVAGLFERRPDRWGVSRIDFAVDVRCDALPASANLMARAAVEKFAAGDVGETWTASLYGHESSFTGFRWGTGDVVVRCYKKSDEIKLRRKLWMREVWGGETGEVWRLEVQLRGDVLRELVTDDGPMKAQDPGVWLDRAGSIWTYFVGGQGAWCSARERIGDTNRSRWPIHPWWARFAGASWGRRTIGVARRPRHVPRRVRMARKAGRPGIPRRTCDGAAGLLDRRTQDDAVARAAIPDAVSRDYSSAAGTLARLAAIVGRSEALQAMSVLVNEDAIERATDRLVFGAALDTLTASIGAVKQADHGSHRAYQLNAPA